MKKFIIFLLTLSLFSIPVSAAEIDDFYAWYLEEYAEELDMMCNLLADHELEWGSCIGGEAENIDPTNFIRFYEFDRLNIVEGYKEKQSISALINEDYNYRYYGREFYNIATFKIIDNEWQLAVERFARQDLNEEKNYYIKDMIENILIKHPDLDYSSLKYIEHHFSATIYLYFTKNGEEYLATYPLADDNDITTKPNYGDIYTAQELINILEPRFAKIKPLKEGYYYGVGEVESREENTVPIYVYPVAAVGVVTVGASVILFKKRKRPAANEK